MINKSDTIQNKMERLKYRCELYSNNPRFILSRLNKLGNEFNSWFHNRFLPTKGEKIMEKDWDNLIILDACRYDDFVHVSNIRGETSKIKSLSTTTPEWYRTNINGGHYNDTICVSGNPNTSEYVDNFHYCKVLYSDEYWDNDLKTVPPEVIAKESLKQSKKFENKRMISHFMQPHFPPIGPMRSEMPVGGGVLPSEDPDTLKERFGLAGITPHLRGRVDGVTEKKAREAYRESLRECLSVVSNLVDNLEGKTVITSDHGELFGERTYPIPVRGILHADEGLRVKPLVQVPWHEVPFTTRKKIVSEEPAQAQSVDEDIINERLESLGYIPNDG